jgi:uncharacterized membrane protein YbhN (UPF0104 family)
VIAGVVDVGGDSAALSVPMSEIDRAGADREVRLSAADRGFVGSRWSRESRHFVVRAGHRLRALAGRRRGVLTVASSLLVVGVLGLVLAGRWTQFAGAAVSAPWWMLAAAAALQTASLLARSESWNVTVHAAGGTVGRRCVYRAAGVGYLGNVINGELGFAVRIASLRRSAPQGTPKTVTLAASEIPIVLTEVAFATLFSFTLVAPLGLPWWTPLVGLGVVIAVVGVSLDWPGATRADGGKA